AFSFEGEVDHHDRVFFDDTDQQDDADERDDGQVDAANHQGQQRSDTCGRQRRQNRYRMDVTLVQYPQHDVDGAQRGQYEHRLVGQRVLEGLSGSREVAVDAARKSDVSLGGVD